MPTPEFHRPAPSHLETRDPAKADARDLADLLLLMPEDAWDRFLALAGARDEGGEARYRGVRFRKAAVTAVVAQEGF